VRRPHPQRHLQHQRLGPQPPFDLLDRAEVVGPLAVELVDQRQPGHAVAVGLPPDRLALGLHPLAGAEHHHRPVEHPQAPLHLGGEVDVAGGVDQVDRRVGPAERNSRGVDRDPPLLLLRIEVGDGRAPVHIAKPVAGLGVEEHPLGERRLAGIDVGHDADVADGLNGSVHKKVPATKSGVFGMLKSSYFRQIWWLAPFLHAFHGADPEQAEAVAEHAAGQVAEGQAAGAGGPLSLEDRQGVVERRVAAGQVIKPACQ